MRLTSDRDNEIYRLWRSESLSKREIAARFGITKQRVSQIVARIRRISKRTDKEKGIGIR
jgi:DNA-directed RNA polymerase specialized sigma subunit